jgi:hypothetical protein
LVFFAMPHEGTDWTGKKLNLLNDSRLFILRKWQRTAIGY